MTLPADLSFENPVLVEVRRSGRVESQHRGAWARVDPAGDLVEGFGDVDRAHFARSTIKSLQALPLLETGAADAFELGPRGIALALASHNAEHAHTRPVADLLSRLGLDVDALQCGAQPPGAPEVRAELKETGAAPTALHNNCSGKHAGFLTLARHLGSDPADYLDPESPVQRAVKGAVAEMCDVDVDSLEYGVDGCSAPTFLLSVRQLATGFARVADPSGLTAERADAARRMTAAVADHPNLIAGDYKRLCTDLARVTHGRLFPKIGAEGMYCVGNTATGEGFAVKLDDGQARGLHAATVGLLERFGWLDADESDALRGWRSRQLTNWAGREVGSVTICE